MHFYKILGIGIESLDMWCPGPVVPHLEVHSGSGTPWPYVHNLGSYNILLVLKHYVFLGLFNYLADCLGSHSGPGQFGDCHYDYFLSLDLI